MIFAKVDLISMKTRFLLHAASSYQSLKHHNPQFNFAKRHALRLFKSNAIYSFIPKNACSTLRLSLAIDNGVIKNTDDFQWIHNNNDTFSAELADLATADYTFVVLRCPYRRLASVYLDKIVGWKFSARQLQKALKGAIDLNEVTFTDFVKELKKQEIRTCDIHWREQVDFLIYEEYDDYFCVEDFEKVVSQLKQKIDLKVIDARNLTKHGSDQYILIDENEDFSRTRSLDILYL
ncbi:MAG: sulfotransferase family protein, partial [Symploca sp. SIO1A3]|nr:sulfotransferase family protein [Symploca sp. SIO1A3]